MKAMNQTCSLATLPRWTHLNQLNNACDGVLVFQVLVHTEEHGLAVNLKHVGRHRRHRDPLEAILATPVVGLTNERIGHSLTSRRR